MFPQQPNNKCQTSTLHQPLSIHPSIPGLGWCHPRNHIAFRLWRHLWFRLRLHIAFIPSTTPGIITPAIIPIAHVYIAHLELSQDMRKETSAAKMMGWVSPGHAKLNGTVLHIFACYKPLCPEKVPKKKKTHTKKVLQILWKSSKDLSFSKCWCFPWSEIENNRRSSHYVCSLARHFCLYSISAFHGCLLRCEDVCKKFQSILQNMWNKGISM